MKIQQTILSITIVSLALITSCSKQAGYTPTCTGTKSFATDVQPIIQASCANSVSCHATGSHQGPGPLTSYAQVAASKSSIKSQVTSGAMPQGSSLSSAQKDAIICWINDGGQNN